MNHDVYTVRWNDLSNDVRSSLNDARMIQYLTFCLPQASQAHADRAALAAR